MLSLETGRFSGSRPALPLEVQKKIGRPSAMLERPKVRVARADITRVGSASPDR